MEENSEVEEKPQSLVKKIAEVRWVWLGVTVALLAISALVLVSGFQQNQSLQVQVNKAQSALSAHQKLVDEASSVDQTLITCAEMVASRIQHMDSFKSYLATISNEYKNMYHAGIGNMNVDAYIEALNNVAAVTEALDGQNMGACNAK